LQYFDLPLEALRAAYARFDALAARESAAVPHPPRTPVRSPGARLRIGYVSGDFRSHVMGRLMWEVLSRHDRARFECLLFSLVAPRADDVLTQRFIGLADGFIDLSQLDDAAAARLIAERQIDVLVDLGGHTMSARPRIYFHRPARRLVTHLGYHGALGLSHCDGKISDAIADPPGTEAWQLEPPLRLDACLFPLVPAERAGAVLEAPAGLDGAFVFAAFVNILKLSPRCLAAWRAVLERVPRAKLLFSPFARGDRELLERVCAKAGIAAARLAFLDLPPGDARLASRYRLVHAALDTFPYGGGDTTLAALSNGVPVVTLAGRRHAERIGASLLTHAGVPELIAADEAQFADLGARLADDPAWRRGIGARLEAAFAHADAHLARHVRELERVFRELAQ
jgi:predicted O-linked N-acetylglucosamine transferase (SPINDLY family)